MIITKAVAWLSKTKQPHHPASCATKLKEEAWCPFRCGGLGKGYFWFGWAVRALQALTNSSCVCVCVVSTRTITSCALVAPLLKGTCPFSSPPLFCTIYSFCLLTFSTFSSQLLRLGTRRRVFLFSRYKLGSQPETNPLTTWINT